jgi:4-hydroxy-3-polyprenylbenzoate decarboxylase
MGFDATRKLPAEGYHREWPQLVRMDEAVKARVDALVKKLGHTAGTA